LSFPLTFYLIWKEGSSPPLLQRFLAQDEVADPDP
jgi:hypothetical protein